MPKRPARRDLPPGDGGKVRGRDRRRRSVDRTTEISSSSPGRSALSRQRSFPPAPTARAWSCSAVPTRCRKSGHGGGGAMTKIVCGYLACDSTLFDTILAPLPRVMIVNMRDSPGSGLPSSASASPSLVAQRAGAGTVLRRSSPNDVRGSDTPPHREPAAGPAGLAGLRDRFVGKSLALMHAETGASLDRGRAGGPRRTFALGTSRAVHRAGRPADGDGPAGASSWRPTCSARAGVAAVGADVGYESEAAFNRAFKRELGVTPAAWRRRLQRRMSVRPLAETHGRCRG